MGQKYAIFNQDGFPKAFYDDEIHTNIPTKAIQITEEQWKEFIENQGQRKWNFQTNQIEVYTPPPPTLEELKQQKQKTLIQMQKQRVQNMLDQYGYISLADVQFYASQNDTEAQSILNWYQAYDDLIWQYINNDLQAFTTVDELLDLDIRQVEEEIYQNSIITNSLP